MNGLRIHEIYWPRDGFSDRHLRFCELATLEEAPIDAPCRNYRTGDCVVVHLFEGMTGVAEPDIAVLRIDAVLLRVSTPLGDGSQFSVQELTVTGLDGADHVAALSAFLAGGAIQP